MKSKLINDKFNTRFVDLNTSDNISDIGSFGVKKLLRVVVIILVLIKEIIFFRPKLVHVAISARGFGFYRDFLFIVILKAFRKPIIIHLHSKGISENSNRLLHDRASRYLFRQSKVILLSKILYSDIANYVDIKNVYICPNGIEKRKDVPTDSELEKKPRTILFLSNLIESKGVLVLLESLAILRDIYGDEFKCLIVGGEADITRQHLEARINELGLVKHVHYLGKKFGSEKHQIFLQADIFILPTRYPNECFPLVILEAMQYSIPVVSSNEGAIAEIVDNNKTGIVLADLEPLTISKSVLRLLENPLLIKSMGLAARQKFLLKYTNTVFENRMIEILDEEKFI